MKRAAIACSLAALSSAAIAQRYETTQTGIIVHPAHGPDMSVQLQVYGDGIIRVTEIPATLDFHMPASMMVRAKPVKGGFTVTKDPGTVTLSTGNTFADVDLNTGKVRFRDAAGNIVLA